MIMTVAELIEKLKLFDPDMRVVTPGFEGFGYDDIGEPHSEKIALNTSESGCLHGRHEDWESFSRNNPEITTWSGGVCNVVVIGSYQSPLGR